MTLRTITAGLALAALTLPAATPVVAQEATLRITLQLPLQSPLGQNLVLFQNEVEALSDGEIAVEIIDDAERYTDAEVPDAVATGEIEMGVAPITRYAQEIPAVDVFFLPFLINTDEIVRAAIAADSELRRLLEDAILETGAKVLWWQPYGSVVLLSDGAPVATPEAIEGKRVRVFGQMLADWVETLDGDPVLVSGSEQADAYQRGAVDIGMTSVSSVASRSLWDMMDTITTLNVADIAFVVVINRDVWEGLNVEQQLWVNEAASRAQHALRERMAEIEEEAYAAAEAEGMTIVEPSEDELDAWREASAPVVDRWLARAGDLGRQVYEAAQELESE